MAQFRKKPVVIEAIQYNNLNYKEICEFIGITLAPDLESETAYLAGKGAPIFSLSIPTLEGKMKAMPSDWIIKGVAGEFYPCKNEIFLKSYNPAEDSENQPPALLSTILANQVMIMKALFSDDFKGDLPAQIDYAQELLDKIQVTN